MDELFVARLWMVGVLAMMVLFGVIALVGYYRARSAGTLIAVADEGE